MAKTKAAKAAAAPAKGKRGAKAEPVKQAPHPKVHFRKPVASLIWRCQRVLR